MVSIQHKRKEASYLRAVSDIVLEEITNANVSLPTVTGVKLSNDGSHLNVYVTFSKNKEKSLEALIGTEGFVRSRLATIKVQRMVPAVHFKLDESADKGQRINTILEEIKNERKS